MSMAASSLCGREGGREREGEREGEREEGEEGGKGGGAKERENKREGERKGVGSVLYIESLNRRYARRSRQITIH